MTSRPKYAATVLLAALLAFPACAGDDGGPSAPSSSEPTSEPTALEPDPRLVPLLTQGPGGPTQEPRIGHASARRICSSADVGLLAAAYGTEATEEAVAAEMAARVAAPADVRDAVREGCLEGFPATAACLAGWNDPENAELRAATAGSAGADVYAIGATHTPALDAVDACVLLVSPPGSDPFETEGWQPAAVHVRTGGAWVGASALVGEVTSPTAIAVPSAGAFSSVVVVLPLEPAATVEADGSLAPRSE